MQRAGGVALASYLFRKPWDGKFEILGKFAKAEFTHGNPNYDQKTTETS
jgi:hypothetical protein